MTIPALIAAQDAAIRNQTTANSITKGNVTDVLTADTNELLARGVCRVATTAALSTLDPDNFRFVHVDNYGLFYWTATGPANGTTIFAAASLGFWTLYIYAGVAPSALVSSVTNSDGYLTISPNTGAVVINFTTPPVNEQAAAGSFIYSFYNLY